MIQDEKTLLILFLSILLVFVVSPVSAAYGTIDKVVVSAPSSAEVDQPVLVQATVYTKASG